MRILPKKTPYMPMVQHSIGAQVKKYGSPLHVVVPEYLKQKIQTWQKHCNKFPIEFYAAHKATQSSALLRVVQSSGMRVDVSSEGELTRAISCGFKDESIVCTGPKNSNFLKKAIEGNLVISVDSVDELNRIIPIASGRKLRILVRVKNILNIYNQPSRFGVSLSKLSEVAQKCREENIDIIGLHFHKDGYNVETKTLLIERLIDALRICRQLGHSASIVDIGGGVKAPQFEHPEEWLQFTKLLQQELLKGEVKSIWGQSAYGMYLGPRGTILGSDVAESAIHVQEPLIFFESLMSNQTSKGISVADLLQECGVTLWIEPGYSMFYDCGCSIASVIGTSDCGQTQTLVDANVFSFSARMFPLLADPLLLSANSDKEKYTFSSFLVGNLCREDDFILQRKVWFESRPEQGDMLLFANTAAYQQHYESTDSQMQKKATYLVLKSNKGYTEGTYEVEQ